MTATLVPVGVLKNYAGEMSEVAVEPGRPVRQILTDLGIPAELVALVTVNGVQQDKDYLVKDGDVIKLLAVMGGG
jgi:sulfur carrier protein ThiS